MQEFYELNKDLEYKKFNERIIPTKYEIVGIFTPEEEKRNSWVTEDMLIFFKTNNDNYIKYRKGENITLKGKIKSIEQNKLGKGYTINMIE